jgi:hypothetical protein
MPRTLLIAVALLFTLASMAFGHAGEVHNYMGTVTLTHDDRSFMLAKTDGEEMHVRVDAKTVYLRADNSAASASDLIAGSRVVVRISEDGETATHIRIAAAKK